MANTLGVYNPIFYAQEALIQLWSVLGMASRVHMGFDEERRAFRRGDTINIRRPSTFTARNAPSTAQDLDTETATITLNNWKEVKFKLTDKELAYTQERIIDDHIAPAAYALADQIDQDLALLYKDVPWYYDQSGASAVVADITAFRKVLFDNKVPLYEEGRCHCMIDSIVEADLLALEAFAQQQGAGDRGVNTQTRGSLGTKYGFEFFANQNVQTHTPGVAADSTGAIDLAGGYSKGDTTIHIDAVTSGATFKVGDIVTITGHTQQYVIAADATFTGSTEGDITIAPGLEQDTADDTVVTINLEATDVKQNLAFHRNAFAIVMAPLSEMGNELGAQIATVQDPVTGLALRSRLYYVGDSSEVHVALDCLYGVETLDPNLAVRFRSPAT